MTSASDSSARVSSGNLLFAAVYVFFWPALLFVLAGNWRWPEGWLFSAWFLTICYGSMAWLYKRDPALLAERFRKPGSGMQRGWDVYAVYAIELLFILWIAIMPLDAQRFHWSPPLPTWLEAVGGGLMLVASYFLICAFRDNTFLSPLVRIQSERSHKVVSNGVYGIVRHPMYLGAVALFVGAPLLLGSCAGIAVAVLTSVLLAARILGEEKMLVHELDGYAEYKARVRYRLIPHVW